MFEKFTDAARKVMAYANEEAQRFEHPYIGTEHILLGLAKESSGVGGRALKNLDVDIKKLRLQVDKLVKSKPDMVTWGKLPSTPRAKKAIEYAIEEAVALNHNYIGTEHILLGLLRQTEGVHGKVLMTLGLKLADLRKELLTLLGAYPEEKEPNTFDTVVPFTLLIDPGDATAEELSQLFLEISTLYRMLGGSGVNFTIVDAKEPALA